MSVIKKKYPSTESKFPFEDDNPSQVIETYWIIAVRKHGGYPPKGKTTDPSKSGKWLIFVEVKNIDEVWRKIKTATENGLLGAASKVSTSKPNSKSSDPNKRVICIYTYDYTDKEDVLRVREELRKIGIVSKIPYKTDVATREGQYEVNGNTRISTYYE